MTLLHLAARAHQYQLCIRIVDIELGLVNALTSSSRIPGKWSALQCMVETPQLSNENCRGEMATFCALLCSKMSPEALGNSTTTGATVFHMAAARGHFYIIDGIAAHLQGASLQGVLDKLNRRPAGETRNL